MTSKLNQSIELTTGKVANLVRHCEASIQRSLGPTDSLERPLKKSTNQKKYSTTSNDTSQRSAAHSRKIHIRAARRKKTGVSTTWRGFFIVTTCFCWC